MDGASAAPHNRRGGAHSEFSGNWLQASLVGDDALLVLATAREQRCPPRQLFEVRLQRQHLFGLTPMLLADAAGIDITNVVYKGGGSPDH